MRILNDINWGDGKINSVRPKNTWYYNRLRPNVLTAILYLTIQFQLHGWIHTFTLSLMLSSTQHLPLLVINHHHRNSDTFYQIFNLQKGHQRFQLVDQPTWPLSSPHRGPFIRSGLSGSCIFILFHVEIVTNDMHFPTYGHFTGVIASLYINHRVALKSTFYHWKEITLRAHLLMLWWHQSWQSGCQLVTDWANIPAW